MTMLRINDRSTASSGSREAPPHPRPPETDQAARSARWHLQVLRGVWSSGLTSNLRRRMSRLLDNDSAGLLGVTVSRRGMLASVPKTPGDRGCTQRLALLPLIRIRNGAVSDSD